MTCLVRHEFACAGSKVKALARDAKGYVPEAPWVKHKKRKQEAENLPDGASREPSASYLTQLSILFIRYAPSRVPDPD